MGIVGLQGGLLTSVLEEKHWKVPVASATQSAQPCAKGTWKTPSGTCSILNFGTRGIVMMDPSNFNILSLMNTSSQTHRNCKETEDKCNSMQIPLLFQQYKTEIARKTKSGNNCYLCCHSHSASQGSLLKIS